MALHLYLHHFTTIRPEVKRLYHSNILNAITTKSELNKNKNHASRCINKSDKRSISEYYMDQNIVSEIHLQHKITTKLYIDR